MQDTYERLTPEMVDALDIEALEGIEASLVYRTRDIDAQLAGSDPRDRDQTQWRRRAAYAKNKMSGELVLVRHRLRHLRRLETARPNGNMTFTPRDPHSLLAAAYDVLCRIARDLEGDLDPEEQSVIAGIRDYLQMYPQEAAG